MTDFRARGTIMGLAGLTAVFGMGTGVAPPVWSPECGRQTFPPSRSRVFRWFVSRGFVCGRGQQSSEWILRESEENRHWNGDA